MRLRLKCAEEQMLALSVLVDAQLLRDGPLVLVAVAGGVSTNLRVVPPSQHQRQWRVWEDPGQLGQALSQGPR